MQRTSSRRQFLKTASVGTAALTWTASSYARVVGANDRISIGLVGCGRRGIDAHMRGVHAHRQVQNHEVTAVCDPWRVARDRAVAKATEFYGRAPRAVVSYRDVLAMDDVDAVMIASCDHQHTVHLEATAKAGKDVYCEKPLGMELEKLKSACDAVKQAGIVCQIGTQVRSWPTSTGCREVFGSGVLGTVSRIEQVRNGAKPYWYSRLAEAKPEDVDWKEFLTDRPMRPFRADHFTGWYGYNDFSHGPIPGLASHFIDLINYITGSKFPTSVVGQAGTFIWKDEHGFTCPDQVQAAWTYPEGFMVSYSTNFGNASGSRLEFYGDQGVMRLNPWNRPTVSRDGAGRQSTLGEETPVEPIDTPDHFLDWLQCIRTRDTCNAPIEAGYRHAVAVIMAVEACNSGRRQVYDVEKRQISPG